MEILKRTKENCEKLASSILQQDNLTKDRVNVTLADKFKNVELLQERYKKASEELEALTQQVECGRDKLCHITSEYEELVDQNKKFKETECILKSQEPDHVEDHKTIDELRWKLKLFKTITGLRFDLNVPDDIISGYVAIKGNKPDNSNLVPFVLKKNEVNATETLWEKIREASDIEEDKENVTSVNVLSEFQRSLHIK